MQFSSYTVPNHSNGSFSFQLLFDFPNSPFLSFISLRRTETPTSYNPTALSPFSFTPPIQCLLSCAELAEKGLFTPPIRICHVRHLMRKQYTLSHRIITQLKLKSSDQKPLRGETAPTPNPFHLLLSSDYRSYTPPPRRRSEPALTHPTSRYNLLRKKFPARSFIGSPVLCDSGFDLLNKLLTYDPEKRITAEAALKHDWFSNLAA